ncbi:hypothetical protein DPMN_073114 [Dreissena polymorpha]|uniref:TatD n=1 Tax=Dreissena polymorpha TaxID=45954 RepID=A0A9D4HAH0_DREPO|nr:hypothetical protein DPMN_073114 [Dreissena polymorpha]
MDVHVSHVREKLDKQEMPTNQGCCVPGCTLEGQDLPRVHAFRHHIPGIFDDRLPCNDASVVKGRVMALTQVATWLLRCPCVLSELVDLVNRQRVLAPLSGVRVSPDCRQAMVEVCNYLGVSVPQQFVLSPANSPAVLIHWRVLSLLAAILQPEDRDYWRSVFPCPSDIQLQSVKSLPVAFDSHFHIDRLRNAAQAPCMPVDELMELGQVEDHQLVRLVGGIGIFCDPNTFPSPQDMSGLPSNVGVVVGLHPKHSTMSNDRINNALDRVRNMLKCERVVGLGEIGLDHSVADKQWPRQNDLVRAMLHLINDRHVVVVHCRGASGDSGVEAYLLLLHLLSPISRTQRFHVHCFTGDTYVLTKWLAAFPNTFFSFNRNVQGFSLDQSEALRSLDENKLLLETDAPYFRATGQWFSAPNQLFQIAEGVAKCRNIPVEHFLEVSCNNALRLYRMQ